MAGVDSRYTGQVRYVPRLRCCNQPDLGQQSLIGLQARHFAYDGLPMRRLVRVCARAHDGGENFAFVSIVVVSCFLLFSGVFFFYSFPVRPVAHLLDYWLLLVLGVSFLVWRVLRFRGAVDAGAEPGFVLAAFGLFARHYCHLVVFGLAETWGSHSRVEETADARGWLLIATHRYGGLVAFAVGLGLAALFSVRRGRAGARGPGSPRSAVPTPRGPAAGGLTASPR